MTVRNAIVATACLACGAWTTLAGAQTTAVPSPPPAWLQPNAHSDEAAPTRIPTDTDARGARRVAARINSVIDGWSPRIGTITPGSGVAFGAAYQQPLFDGKARVTADGMLSVRGYSAVALGAYTTPFETRPVMLGLRLRHERYPQENFYGLGPSSGRGDRTSYLREGLDVTAYATVAPRSWLSLEGSAGFLNMNVGSGTQADVPSIADRFDATRAPGLGASADMIHVGLAAEVDWRDDGFFPRSGGRYFAGVTAFHGLSDAAGTFTRMDADIRQYFGVPKTTTHVIAVRSQLAFSGGASDSAGGRGGIPFYLLPRLGGSGTLRAYDRSRFIDRHAMVFTVEHRWLVMPMVQLVGFADAGQVAPSLGDFDLSELRTSVGAGVRVLIKKAAVVRLDYATGREGSRWLIGVGPSF